MGGVSSRADVSDLVCANKPMAVKPKLTAIGGGEFWIIQKDEVGELLQSAKLTKVNDTTYRLATSPAMIFTPRSLTDLINIVGERKLTEAVRDFNSDWLPTEGDIRSYSDEIECFYLVSYVDVEPNVPAELESPVVNNDYAHPMSRRSSAASFITPLPSCVGEEQAPPRTKIAVRELPKPKTQKALVDEVDEDEDIATVPQGEENTSLCLNAQATSVAEVIDSFVEGVESGQSEIGETPPPSQRKRITRRRPTSTRASKASPTLPNKWELYCISENNPSSSHRQKREHNKSPIKTSPPPASKRIRS